MVLKKFLRLIPKSPKPKLIRGSADAKIALEILTSNWNEITVAYNRCSKDEKQELIDHFNTVTNEVGDALFGGNVNDFKSKIDGLNDEEQESFVERLKESELIDTAYC